MQFTFRFALLSGKYGTIIKTVKKKCINECLWGFQNCSWIQLELKMDVSLSWKKYRFGENWAAAVKACGVEVVCEGASHCSHNHGPQSTRSWRQVVAVTRRAASSSWASAAPTPSYASFPLDRYPAEHCTPPSHGSSLHKHIDTLRQHHNPRAEFISPRLLSCAFFWKRLFHIKLVCFRVCFRRGKWQVKEFDKSADYYL